MGCGTCGWFRRTLNIHTCLSYRYFPWGFSFITSNRNVLEYTVESGRCSGGYKFYNWGVVPMSMMATGSCIACATIAGIPHKCSVTSFMQWTCGPEFSPCYSKKRTHDTEGMQKTFGFSWRLKTDDAYNVCLIRVYWSSVFYFFFQMKTWSYYTKSFVLDLLIEVVFMLVDAPMSYKHCTFSVSASI